MIFNKCKRSKPCDYCWSALCTNCHPINNEKYYDISIRIPFGISLENFFKDPSRQCPNCGLIGTLSNPKTTQTQEGSSS